MFNQTPEFSTQNTISVNKLAISREDQEILRRLADRVAQLAARPIQDEKRNLWSRHNRLEAIRPLISCNPENGWNEIITENQIQLEEERGIPKV